MTKILPLRPPPDADPAADAVSRIVSIAVQRGYELGLAAAMAEPVADAAPDVSALHYALTRMHPDLNAAPMLPGESIADAHARRAASADILDDLLDEYGRQAAEEVAA